MSDAAPPAAGGEDGLDRLPTAELEAIAASGAPGASLVAKALLVERGAVRVTDLTAMSREERRRVLFGRMPAAPAADTTSA